MTGETTPMKSGASRERFLQWPQVTVPRMCQCPIPNSGEDSPERAAWTWGAAEAIPEVEHTQLRVLVRRRDHGGGAQQREITRLGQPHRLHRGTLRFPRLRNAALQGRCRDCLGSSRSPNIHVPRHRQRGLAERLPRRTVPAGGGAERGTGGAGRVRGLLLLRGPVREQRATTRRAPVNPCEAGVQRVQRLPRPQARSVQRRERARGDRRGLLQGHRDRAVRGPERCRRHWSVRVW